MGVTKGRVRVFLDRAQRVTAAASFDPSFDPPSVLNVTTLAYLPSDPPYAPRNATAYREPVRLFDRIERRGLDTVAVVSVASDRQHRTPGYVSETQEGQVLVERSSRQQRQQ